MTHSNVHYGYKNEFASTTLKIYLVLFHLFASFLLFAIHTQRILTYRIMTETT